MTTVVQVFGSLDAGGAESRMMDVYRAIDRQKWRFVFVSLDTADGQFYEDEIRRLGGEVVKISVPRKVGVRRHFRELLTVLKRLRREGAVAVHSHTSYHSGVVLAAALLAGYGVRIAHARTTSSIHRSSLGSRAAIALGKTLIRMNATERLALNDETALALYGRKADGKSVRILPNAIALERFSNAEAAADLADIPEGATVVGHVGRFQPMKNHGFLLEFFAAFLEDHPDSYLVLVGDGPLREGIERKAAGLGLSERVRFLGLRRDIPEVMKRFDVFVLPSVYEGLVGSVLEAQASGVACVASDTVAQNVDMGLGLVEFVGLEAPVEAWVRAVEAAADKTRPDFATIRQAFERRGFTLESEIRQLTELYENTHNNNHDI